MRFELVLSIFTLALGVFTLSFQNVWVRLVYFVLCIVGSVLVNVIMNEYNWKIKLAKKKQWVKYDRRHRVLEFLKKLEIGKKIENVEGEFTATRTKCSGKSEEIVEEMTYSFNDGVCEASFKTIDDVVTTISFSE